MGARVIQLVAVSLYLALAGCGQGTEKSEGISEAPTVHTASDTTAAPYIVDVRAVGMTFEMPTQIKSGWVTFRLLNASSMLHFALIDVPPGDVPYQSIADDLMIPFQEAMDAMNAEDEAGVQAAFGRFPAWIGDLKRAGGPGFLSPGLTGETTVYLEPGRYVLECYIKSDGVFHSTPQPDGTPGMTMEFHVTEEQADAPEPQADAILTITNTGYALSGSLKAGSNTIRVNFDEQQALPSFVGNDVHLIKVDDRDTIARVDAWMDWRTPEGLEDPAPATFIGGINDLPQGKHGYFAVTLTPGNYAFVSEMPNPVDAGFSLPFSISE